MNISDSGQDEVMGTEFTFSPEKNLTQKDNKCETVVFKTVNIKQQRTMNLEQGEPRDCPHLLPLHFKDMKGKHR